MRKFKTVLPIGLVWVAMNVSGAQAESGRVLAEWRFDSTTNWNGWTPNSLIRNVRFDVDGVSFDSTGSDPIISGPVFDLPTATNRQWVEIELDAPHGGLGELFYTNATQGRYGGFEPRWMEVVAVPGGGRQTVNVWPFWSGLGHIAKIRFDPPAGRNLRLRAIRVVEWAGAGPAPSWTFGEQVDSWQSMYAAQPHRTSEGLQARATRPQAVIITPVEPFDAARRSVLHLEAVCPGEASVALYWASAEEQGLFGQPLQLTDGSQIVDLRRWPEWTGTITHLAIAFGTVGHEQLTLRSLSIENNDQERPYFRAHYFDFDRGVVRAGQQADVRLILEHAGGPPTPAAPVRAAVEPSGTDGGAELRMPAMKPGDRAELRLPVQPSKAAGLPVTFTLQNGQVFTKSLRVEEAISDPALLERPDGYDVPTPRPLKTNYQIGIYYFPGWSADQMSRWRKQTGFPERDALLGWYEEGHPEVADWHIKWAVENGISFFIYDWYWRDGREQLGAGLNEGFLEARYNELMKFAIMWANHPPYSKHTREQLLRVTDYWIDRYFNRPNYLKVDGQPYVSFFSTGDLINDMGSEENVRTAFAAMRERARQAGLPGIHFAACTGPDPVMLESLERAGFDSCTAYNYVSIGTVLNQSPYRHYMYAHEEVWRRMSGSGVLPYIPLLTVNWDARPWHGPRTRQKFDRRPEYFAEGLERLKAHLDRTGGRMAILEAWNEWGEGSYLEPTVEFGFQDLEALRSIFAAPGSPVVQNVSPYDVGLHGKYDLRR